MASLNGNLNISGTPILSAYNQYMSGGIRINRKYQRKLIWTTNEKANFIDSLLKSLPIPLILAAEIESKDDGRVIEIIDGMQRLNAIFSYLDMEFPVDGVYFDRTTLGYSETDREEDGNSRPKLNKGKCIELISYALPISTYRAGSEQEVEEIFRRINSNGRHLSRQEIRQAGSISPIASLVRKTSVRFRNDVSLGDRIDLKKMPEISLTDSNESRGIQMNDVFWIQQRILTKEQLRESRDEEIVLDILATSLLGPEVAYDSKVFDEYYGLRDPADSDRKGRLEAKIKINTPEVITSRAVKVLDTFKTIFDYKVNPFYSHFFTNSRARVPRYFECVYLAIYALIFEENLELTDIIGVREKLRSYGSNFVKIPGGGGTWTAKSKKENVDQIKGVLREFFTPFTGVRDPLREKTATDVMNLLAASHVEASLFELKQGFCTLNSRPNKNNSIIQEIATTLSAMVNSGGPQTKGYLIVGVCDEEKDAKRIKALRKKDLPVVSDKYISGLKIDQDIHGSLDNLLQWVTNKFQAIETPTDFKDQILRDIRIAEIEGEYVALFTVQSLDNPVHINGKYYKRQGSETLEVPADDYHTLFTKFMQK